METGQNEHENKVYVHAFSVLLHFFSARIELYCIALYWEARACHAVGIEQAETQQQRGSLDSQSYFSSTEKQI